MASRKAEALALVGRVRRVGWPVTMIEAGAWQVTCPDKTRVQIHLTPSDVNQRATVTRLLNRHGFAEAEAAATAKEKAERTAKLEADRARNATKAAQAAKKGATLRATLAKAAGPYATPDVTIDEILAKHPAPIVWLKVTVTQAMATRMLDHNTHNRSESGADQREWEGALRTGRARHTHQGIAFDVLGRLVDGQTRLKGIEESGIAADLMVSAGWPAENFTVVDTGRRRTPAQVLKMEGTTAASWIAPAAKLLHLWNVWGHLMLDHLKDRVSNDQILDVAEKLDKDDMHEALRVASGLRGQIRKVPPAGTMASMYLIRRAMSPDYELVDEFVDRLIRGVAQDDDPMVFAVRRRLTNAAMNSKDRLNGGEVMALILKAWNARMDGHHGAHLTVRGGSIMPAPRTPAMVAAAAAE